MPIRTINYTNRKRILREHVSITLNERGENTTFDAILHLSGYKLPPEARVFVEAYRQTQYKRFDFGTVGLVHVPADRSLSDFGSAEGVLFRVKVVTSNDPRGMLLAEADQIRPRKSKDEDENRMPLLTVMPNANMGDEIWRLEFDEQQTRLFVNSALGDWRGIARDRVFISLVYPSVFRYVLWRILHQERHFDTDDMDDWRSRWLRFAVSLPGVNNVPAEEDEDQFDDWIENAVYAFCRRHNIRALYENYWTGGWNR